MIDRPCRISTRAVNVVSSGRFSQHSENNKSKRRQRELIPSWLEKCGLGIITYSLCVFKVCVNINNDELFCNAFRLKMHIYICIYSLLDVVCTYYCVARVTCLVVLITSPYKTLPILFDFARFLTLCISMQRNKSDQPKHGLHGFLLK